MSLDSPSYVHITLGEHLPAHSASWFDGLQVTNLPNGYAVLAGVVTDQSALFGILIRIRDLGIRLISLDQKSPEEIEHQG